MRGVVKQIASRPDALKNDEDSRFIYGELQRHLAQLEEEAGNPQKANELNESFKAFKREIIKEARFSRNGKPIKLKRILAFESAEEAKDSVVHEVVRQVWVC